ncbi:MAG: DegT/DnrJ/EryC1/StrS family aminotransferase, partial [Candidatus Hadarchaeum sp.]
SYVMAEICAAFLWGQLECMEQITERRREIYEFYREHLRPLEEGGFLRLPHIPHNCQSNYHLFYVLTRTPEERDGLLAYLKQNGVHAVFHYVPLHSSPMGRTFGYRPEDLPLTEELAARLIRLPFFYELERSVQTAIVAWVTKFFDHYESSKGCL